MSYKRLFDVIVSRLGGSDLQKSSTLLIGAQATNALGMFLFWIICAHLFPAQSVGLATSFISFGLLVATFTQLGLPVTALRFLPSTKRKGGLVSATLISIMIASVIGLCAALFLIGDLAPKLAFVRDSVVLIVLLVLVIMGTSVAALTDGIMASLKKSKYVFTKAVIMNVPRIFLPFVLIGFGIRGMVGIYAIIAVLGATYGTLVIKMKWLKQDSMRADFGKLLEHRGFAAANYFGSMFGILPGTLVPIIVLNRLGAAEAAYFYMPMQLAAFLSVICSSTCQALLAETAHESDPTKYAMHTLRAAKHLYSVLIPTIIALALIGWPILRIYGEAYVRVGYLPLVILCASSLLVALNWIGDTWLNIKRRSLAYFSMNACNAIAVLMAVYLLVNHGLTSATIGWFIGQTASAAVYMLVFARDQLFALRPNAARYTA